MGKPTPPKGFVPQARINCHDLKAHLEFFNSVAGYDLNRRQGNFVILRSERIEILLNGVGGSAGNTPRVLSYQEPRVEIGLVVDELDQAFLAAKKHEAGLSRRGVPANPGAFGIFRVTSPKVTTCGSRKNHGDSSWGLPAAWRTRPFRSPAHALTTDRFGRTAARSGLLSGG